jgi:hypothetical protein
VNLSTEEAEMLALRTAAGENVEDRVVSLFLKDGYVHWTLSDHQGTWKFNGKTPFSQWARGVYGLAWRF